MEGSQRLRVTYIGYDYFSAVLLHLLTRPDVTITRVVTEANLGGHVCKIAQAAAIPLLLARVRGPEIAAFAADSDLLLCASYGYRLPIPEQSDCRFLNLHPSLLPLGRGPVSPHWTLTRFPESAGVTLHVMDNGFDTGAIVAQIPLAVHAGSNLEIYTYQANQAAIELLSGIDLARLHHLQPKPQDHAMASYQPELSIADRTISNRNTGAEILRLTGALGSSGALVEIGGIRYAVTHALFLDEKPAYPADAFVNDFYGYFPCADGICLFPKTNLFSISN